MLSIISKKYVSYSVPFCVDVKLMSGTIRIERGI